MAKLNVEDSGKKKCISKRPDSSMKRNSTKEKLEPQRKSRRVANQDCKTELEFDLIPSDEAFPKQNHLSACSGCKELEAKIQHLQNELSKLKDSNRKPVWPGAVTESLIEKVKELESKISSMGSKNGSKISALCAIEMGHKGSKVEVEIVDDKVNLGQNIFCSLANWQVMNRTDSIPDWCVAILRGTFGVQAKHYRVNPRHQEHKPFGPAFLTVAEAHFCSFLDRRISELEDKEDEFSTHLLNFFKGNRDKLIKQLPASLSDRAYAMYRNKIQTFKSDSSSLKTLKTRQNPSKKSARKMLTQPKLKKGLEYLYQANEESEEEEELED